MVGISAVMPLTITCDAPRPLCGNMSSSTKPEIHNVSLRLRKRTEPWPQATCKKLVKFGRVYELCQRTDRQTDILITILCTPRAKLLIEPMDVEYIYRPNDQSRKASASICSTRSAVSWQKVFKNPSSKHQIFVKDLLYLY